MTDEKVAIELSKLETMTVRELQDRFIELFGDEPSSRNRVWLVRRCAWRIQANAYGGLSERARKRAAELANESDLRVVPPSKRVAPENVPVSVTTVPTPGNERLPPPGSILERPYKGQAVRVRVLESGFECRGKVYRSLSAVAKAITGSHCSGRRFFGLNGGLKND